jgi:dTDP-4-dehydrorhamnose reductase
MQVISMSKNIIVLGSNGQLGSEIKALAETNMTFLSRNDLDLNDIDNVTQYFETHACDTIINCAAYTAVDKAETDIEAATQINIKLVEQLAIIAKEQKISLIHISTDYVFDGTNHSPYKETDKTHPQGIYGQTKLDGENLLLKINPKNSIIIRTSWVYSEFGNNFVKTMLKLGKDRDELGVIFDQVGTPTYAKDLAKAIITIAHQLQNSATEIYHYSNEGVCSWYDFAKAIFELSDVRCLVNPLETYEYPTPAKRPAYSILNKSKIKKDFNLTIPYWRDSLQECIQQLKDNHK